jgi:AraC family transcriptional regulator of adaptative response / DNA-3-methyladenine glycosylase II
MLMEKNGNRTTLDPKACYAALRAHDSRFDGRFFVGVSSTGIYCRPVCRVKLPREENCSWFISAAAAEAAGYRPCLKCRPELAPGFAPADAAARIARKAALLLENDFFEGEGIAEIADKLAVSGRHLRRVFYAEYGVSPVQYRQTRKLLLAKNLLTDTALPITELALSAGFNSLRRFNAAFKERYAMTPGSLRKSGDPGINSTGGITLLLGYRPPYRWDHMLNFLALRAVPGIETVRDVRYMRTLTLRGRDKLYRGWISVADMPARNSLALTLSPSLAPVLPGLLSRVKLFFDTAADPLEIHRVLAASGQWMAARSVPGIRLPGCFDPFEMSVRAVLGQQLTVKAARTLAKRFVEALGESIETPFNGELSRTFPGPEKVYALKPPVENHLGPLGITGARSRSLYALAEALVKGKINLSPDADPEDAMEKLLELPGFGPWTVNYIGMRALSRPDAFLPTDCGVKKALAGKTSEEIKKLAEAWKPWSSYAVINLWNALASAQ